MGSSLIDLSLWNPWGGTLRENFKIKKEIDCFDFSKYVKDNFKVDDYIVCKLDIEGAEYPVLEKMIKDETIPYIKKLYVEFHSNFFTNKEEMVERENYIRSKCNDYGLKIEYWG
jgi:uncharacterized protein YfeS